MLVHPHEVCVHRLCVAVVLAPRAASVQCASIQLSGSKLASGNSRSPFPSRLSPHNTALGEYARQVGARGRVFVGGRGASSARIIMKR
jgi:hypothetical protein